MNTKLKLKCTALVSALMMLGSLSMLTAAEVHGMQQPVAATEVDGDISESEEYTVDAPYSLSVVGESAESSWSLVCSQSEPGQEEAEITNSGASSEHSDNQTVESVCTSLAAVEDFGVECYDDIFSFQVNKSYNIPEEFYYDTLPESMHELIAPVCALEREYPISSMYLFAVAATEVGWGRYFVREGNNNWFNWSPDGEYYQGFASTQDCVDYTREAYEDRMFNPEYYAIFGQDVGPVFTIPIVNTRYALLENGEPNAHWGALVGEITFGFIEDYKSWSEA